MKKSIKIKIGIAIILILATTVITVYGYKVYINYKNQQKIAASLSEIMNIDKDFNNKTDRTKKLTILKNIKKEYSDCNKSKETFNEVKTKYESEIKKMHQTFVKGYDEIITKNSIADVSKINDKKVLNDDKTNLQNELKVITDEKGVVCDKKNALEYQNKINVLITSYDTRIKAIEDDEAAAKAAEQNKASTSTSTTTKSSGSSKNSSTSSSSGSTSSGLGSGGTTYTSSGWTDSDGRSGILNSKGEIIGSDGTDYGNLNDWTNGN